MRSTKQHNNNNDKTSVFSEENKHRYVKQRLLNTVAYPKD